MGTPEEREHVTRYFYLNERKFRIASFSAEPPMPQLQMSVDTPEDFARCEAVIASYKGDIEHLRWREMVARYLAQGAALRSEARRVGTECVSRCRSRWSPKQQ